MTIYDSKWIDSLIVQNMYRLARYDVNNGLRTVENHKYIRRCTHYDAKSGTLMIFNRDQGPHSHGWWKNPDYERCFHLSLSFKDPVTGQHRGERDAILTKVWLDLIYGSNQKYIWCEPPVGKDGKRLIVWHYRLFMQPDWKTPLLPRGEVYSKENTPPGFKSFSEVQAELEYELELKKERAADASIKLG